MPLPARQRDDVQLCAECAAVVHVARQFAGRQAVADGDGQDADERLEPTPDTRPFHRCAADGVGPVQHDHAAARAGRAAQQVVQGADEGVEARADILHIEQQDIHPVEHRRGGLFGGPVEAEHRQAGARLHGIGHRCAVGGRAVEAVLRAVQRGQPHARVQQRIERGRQVRQHGGRVRHQADACLPEPGRRLAQQPDDARFDHGCPPCGRIGRVGAHRSD